MAAYAALVSLMYIIEQIKHHPRPPISLHKKQVQSLTEKVTFLQEFLEGYSHVGDSKEADALESGIANAAYAAEDVIESHIVDQILATSTTHEEKIRYFNCFRSQGKKIRNLHQGLRKVIRDLDLIKKEVMEIKEKTGVHHQLHRNSAPVNSLRSSSTGQNIMVGFDDLLNEVMDKLTGQQSSRQIIPIVGMGGIGKTTLARNIYVNRLIKEHFDICVWVTISQEYRMGEILLELLQEGRQNVSQMNEQELGVHLFQKLSGRRYLIVMDDIWDIEVWDQLKFFFPDNNNGSRIMFTTRLSSLASHVANSLGRIDMAFLDKDNSWKLFCKIVFGKEGYPLELEETGKKIVKNCKGLPLSIVVIGGLLRKFEYTREYWEFIGENLNSIVNLEDNEHCLKILHMSYNQLPVYLKPCFLYMGVFPEDSVIRVSLLIKLWVVEGFLKPISGISLEEIAQEYLQELINRNLILVHKLGCTGKIKFCKIHDLIRDLCLREAHKERFYNVTRQDINIQRRFVIHESTSKEEVLNALQSMPLCRSLITWDFERDLRSLNLRLLRLLNARKKNALFGSSYFLENMFQLVKSRFLSVEASYGSKFPSSVHLLWNLHTLIVTHSTWESLTAPTEIWNMPQLRHVEFDKGLHLPDPPSCKVDGRHDIVLGNLQSLSMIKDFKWGEEVIKRIPNIKKLKISYYHREFDERSPNYCLNNLGSLQRLESLHCYSFLENNQISGTYHLQNLTFPHSLKSLNIMAPHVHWEDILDKIGSLPLLEKLKLCDGSFKGHKWETVEGQFRSLKFLQISKCHDLEYWMTESSHFPCLEHLNLSRLDDLKEIPMEMGEIPTLRSISLFICSNSSVISLKKILEEREECGEVGLEVFVHPQFYLL